MKYIPNFLGTSRGATTSGGGGVVSWSPEGYARDGLTGRSRQSRVVDKTSVAHSDAQYGMSILKTSSYDVETSSQEAIVPKEGGGGGGGSDSSRTRNGSDEFGGSALDDEVKKKKGGGGGLKRAGSVMR